MQSVDRYRVAVLISTDRGLWLSDYPRILTELHERNPEKFDLQTIEIAYYQQYREINDVSRR